MRGLLQGAVYHAVFSAAMATDHDKPAGRPTSGLRHPPENGALTRTLDPDLGLNLVALAASRNIGALATIKRGRPAQLSTVTFSFDPAAAMARISMVDGRAKVHTCRAIPAQRWWPTAGWWPVLLESGARTAWSERAYGLAGAQ